MVHLVKKKIKKNNYLYLEHRKWENNKSVRDFSIYLGSETKLIENPKRLRLFQKDKFNVDIIDFGLPATLTRIVEKLDLIEIINQATNKREQGSSVGEYIALAAVNRCVEPSSKSQLRNGFNSSYLKTLKSIYPVHENYLDAMAYVNHFKYIDQNVIEDIELKLVHKLQQQFGVKMDHLSYDPTNFFTYINPKADAQHLPRHGKSKEGRNTLNLVALSLFCTSNEGIPIMHQTYPGNIQDATHFKTEFPRFLNRLLKLGIATSSVVLVFDKGNISVEAFKMIDNSQLTWISSVRPSSHKDLHQLIEQDFVFHTLPNEKQVGTAELIREMHGKDRRLIVCYNAKQQRWNANNLRTKVELKVQAVDRYFEKRLNHKKWRSKKAVLSKIEKLLGKQYLQYIDFQVSGSHAKLNYVIIIKSDDLGSKLETLGKSYLMTNDFTTPAAEIIWKYRQQFTVERAFSYLKGPEQIRVRPMYHYVDSSIRGHMFTCVLALLLLMLLEREVRQFDNNLSLPTIIQLLKQIKVARINFSTQEPGLEKIANMTKEARTLYQNLNLQHLFEKDFKDSNDED